VLLMVAAFGVGGVLGHNNVVTLTPKTRQTPENITVYNENEVDISSTGSIVCIGDSLMVGATDSLLKIFPEAGVDALVGRFMEGGINAVLRTTYGRKIPDVVVIELATNINDNSPKAIEEILDLLQDIKKIVFVTGYGTTNASAFAEKIRALPESDPKIVVADWAAIASTHPEYMAGDGIHLNGTAANEAFAQCIAQAVRGMAE
jgi:hypothetical protein